MAGYDEAGDARLIYVEACDGVIKSVIEHHVGTVGMTFVGSHNICDRLAQGYDPRIGAVATNDHGATPATMSIPLQRMTPFAAASRASR